MILSMTTLIMNNMSTFKEEKLFYIEYIETKPFRIMNELNWIASLGATWNMSNILMIYA